jgi:cysteine desulfurase
MRQPVYLDYNATTPLLPSVIDTMHRAMLEGFGNPSSAHSYGVAAKLMIDTARQQVAQLIGAKSDEIIFTGNATEANNLAILGVAKRAGQSGKNHLITSAIEHPSVMNPCAHLQREGWELTVLPVDQYGRVDPATLKAAIKSNTALVTIMHANNEIGTLQPLAEIAEVTKSAAVPLHVDAAQSIGKVPVDVDAIGADFLTIAGHKFYAPKGIGALYIRGNSCLSPLMQGADHERGIRPGTENVIHIAGIGEAARQAIENPQIGEQLRVLKDLLFSRLRREIPGLILNGHPDQSLPNTLHVSFPMASGKALLTRANNAVAASTGSACHSHGTGVSGVMAAIGATAERAAGSIRLSVGRMTSEDDIAFAADALIAAWSDLVT